MPFITVNAAPLMGYQITLDDILNGLDESQMTVQKDTRDTRTYCVREINPKVIEKTNFRAMYDAIVAFNEKYEALIDEPDKSKLYYSFKIPKRSGGLRQIDAPEDTLKSALYELKQILEKKFYANYHTSAFAYVRGRSIKDALERHQRNNSRFFLKTDLSKFFPSTTFEFLTKMLYMQYPFCVYINEDFGYREALEKALSLCFLNGGLPQGTPTSPMLTNMMCIPIDHAISKMAHEYQPHLCYTRYADDMHISSEFNFNWTDVVNKLKEIFTENDAPFTINNEKTHYGNRNGRNWMLGLMLNKDNNITIGHEKKKVFKAMVFQFMTDYKQNNRWNVEDTQHLQGLVSYYLMVEKEQIQSILNTYSQKFGINVEGAIKEILTA